jgi:MFS family permease
VALGGFLATVGVGLGLFTPANNAAIMAGSREEQAGMVSGLLNMTRGIGTALGVAVAGLASTLAAGPGGYVAALLLLAALGLLAAGLSALRPGRPGR